MALIIYFLDYTSKKLSKNRFKKNLSKISYYFYLIFDLYHFSSHIQTDLVNYQEWDKCALTTYRGLLTLWMGYQIGYDVSNLPHIIRDDYMTNLFHCHPTSVRNLFVSVEPHNVKCKWCKLNCNNDNNGNNENVSLSKNLPGIIIKHANVYVY